MWSSCRRSKARSVLEVGDFDHLDITVSAATVNYTKCIRFADQLENKDLLVASATHPRFRLAWVDWGKRDSSWLEVKAEFEKLVSRESSDVRPAQSSEDEDFFGVLFDGTVSDELQQWKARNDTDLKCLNDFPNIRKLFLRFNTPVPSSAAAERLFSVARDVLTIKRGRLSDENFENQLLLKCNGRLAC